MVYISLAEYIKKMCIYCDDVSDVCRMLNNTWVKRSKFWRQMCWLVNLRLRIWSLLSDYHCMDSDERKEMRGGNEKERNWEEKWKGKRREVYSKEERRKSRGESQNVNWKLLLGFLREDFGGHHLGFILGLDDRLPSVGGARNDESKPEIPLCGETASPQHPSQSHWFNCIQWNPSL